MDTKSKKSKPFTAWLSFFLAVNLLAVFLITCLSAVAHSGGNLTVLQAPFVDYKSTIFFKERSGHYFSYLYDPVGNLFADQNASLDYAKWCLNEEGSNVKYYAVNTAAGLEITNIAGEFSFPEAEQAPVWQDYNYYWYFDGQKLQVIDHGQPVDIQRRDSGYRNILPYVNIDTANSAHTRVLLAVRDTLQENPYGHSRYYSEKQSLAVIGWVYIGAGLLGLALLIYAIMRRRDKREFDRQLASWAGRLWLEVKVLLSLPAAFLLLMLFSELRTVHFDLPGTVFMLAAMSGLLLLGCWWFYVILLDLLVNRSNFFRHNLINSLLKWYQRYERQYAWQKAMQQRAYLLLAAESVLAVMSVLFLLIGNVLLAVLLAGAGIYLIYRYLRYYNQTITDLGKLIDHIELIKNGDMNTRLELAAESSMYPAAQNLNSIQAGMNIAVTEQLKSERLKLDLITNVSHDLKTPLTSIISYVDLLAREEGLPEQANDYIQILAQKSERLKNLIQDLFDLSKASSDNIALDMEEIDLARLLKQTLADMEEPINASGLAFRVNIPDEPVNIVSDGKKLYRVWENLITNTLKYSLAGSRVFIDLTVDTQGALATIKNTANYEMTFGEEEILQRFVRGDQSRSSEGSGLGLSIAQSFTQICGGHFAMKIDGDLFKVELRFKTVS